MDIKLPNNLLLRKLCLKDYYKEYFNLLSQLTECNKLDFEEFKEIYEENEKNSINFIIEDLNKKIIIANFKILFERKYCRNGKYVCRFEDIVVDKDYRKQNIAKYLINYSIKYIKEKEEKNCYKIVGNCSYDLKIFYEKFNFEFKNHEFSYYL